MKRILVIKLSQMTQENSMDENKSDDNEESGIKEELD